MAGAGYKLFATGDVLSASDVNLYLQQQTVMVFASAAARTTALSSVLAEGMVTYLKDTDVVEIYTGAAWVSLDDPNAIQNSIVDAKGDIITATADNTPARLAVGTNGQTLVADSSTATGLKWATAGGGGKVLQVVNALRSVTTSTTSTSYVDTNLTATITPTASTSKILVIVHQTGILKDANNISLALRLVRGSTQLLEFGVDFADTSTSSQSTVTGTGTNYLDSPATTSAVTYKTQFLRNGGAGTVYTNFNNASSTITLMEIGA